MRIRARESDRLRCHHAAREASTTRSPRWFSDRDGRWIAGGAAGPSVTLWDAHTGTRVRSLTMPPRRAGGFDDSISSLVFRSERPVDRRGRGRAQRDPLGCAYGHESPIAYDATTPRGRLRRLDLLAGF